MDQEKAIKKNNSPEVQAPVDWNVFWPAIVIIILICLPMIINPAGASKVINLILAFSTGQLGWLFMLVGMTCFFFCIWLAFGKYGNVKLGRPGEKERYDTKSYVAMMFCTGYGIAILIWSFIEGSYYVNAPAFHWIEPGSARSMEWAQTYIMVHRGFVAWALYCLPTIPIAYALHVRRIPYLRFSMASEGVLGKHAKGPIGIFIDILVVFGILGGVGASMGLAVPLVSRLFSEMFGMPDNFMTNFFVLVIWTTIFGFSVYKGLDKGIKTLSNLNLYLMFVFVMFIFLTGPTLFILDSTVTALGNYMTNFFMIQTWLDPITKGSFPSSWTVFYWAWWVAYSPMMALFVARISRGKTIRQVVFGQCVWGVLGAWSVYAIMGNYTMNLNAQGILNVSQLLSEHGQPEAILQILKTMPFSNLVIIMYTILCFIFLATTLDSSAFTLASVCSKNIKGDEQPARWHRVTWAIIIFLVAVALLLVGGLKTIQTFTVVAAIPLIPIVAILFASFLKWIREDFACLDKKKLAISYHSVYEADETKGHCLEDCIDVTGMKSFDDYEKK